MANGEDTLVIYNARLQDQKEPENYGYFKTLEGAKAECQKHSRNQLEWKTGRDGSWFYAGIFSVFPVEVRD